MLGLDNPIHILFLLVIVLLVFGAKRLPEMGKSLGDGLRGFKESVSGESPSGSPLSAMSALPAAPESVPAPADEPVAVLTPVLEPVPAQPAA